MFERKNAIILLLIILVILLLLKACDQKETIETQANLITAMGDTLHVHTNSKGQEVASIEALQAQSVKYFLTIQTQDATIQKLQEEVKRNKDRINKTGSVTVVTSTTTVEGKNVTTITSVDTVYKNVGIETYPVYEASIKLGKRNDSAYWVNSYIKASKDSISLSAKIENAYTVVIGMQKRKGFKNLFKKKVPIVEVTNENPYTSTKTLRAYVTKSPRPKRFGIGFNVGYGIILDKKPVFRPYIGIGLQYNIIEFL